MKNNLDPIAQQKLERQLAYKQKRDRLLKRGIYPEKESQVVTLPPIVQ